MLLQTQQVIGVPDHFPCLLQVIDVDIAETLLPPRLGKPNSMATQLASRRMNACEFFFSVAFSLRLLELTNSGVDMTLSAGYIWLSSYKPQQDSALVLPLPLNTHLRRNLA